MAHVVTLVGSLNYVSFLNRVRIRRELNFFTSNVVVVLLLVLMGKRLVVLRLSRVM